MKEIDRYAVDNVCKILIGNKCDLLQDRKVSYEEAREFADYLDIPYIECSAQDNLNVQYAFNSLTKEVLDRDYGHKFDTQRVKTKPSDDLINGNTVDINQSQSSCFCTIL